MKIFIDAGANDGCSARLFRKLYDPHNEYRIYSFEVDPIYLDKFSDIENLVFINKAVWVEYGKCDFFRSYTAWRDGGTLIKEKKTGELDKQNPIKVTTIDFSSWIMDTFLPSDLIILKMDIEGAEYKVLNKMIVDGSIDYIDELWIEWHYGKINMPEHKHQELVSRLKMPIRKWQGREDYYKSGEVS